MQAGGRNAGREGMPVFKVVQASVLSERAELPDVPDGSMLDEIVREGARKMWLRRCARRLMGTSTR